MDMKEAPNIVHQFFPVLRARLDQLQLEMEYGASPTWVNQMHALVFDGSFLRLEFGYGRAGEVSTLLSLVTKSGLVVKLNSDLN
jgi:hypothetical protein